MTEVNRGEVGHLEHRMLGVSFLTFTCGFRNADTGWSRVRRTMGTQFSLPLQFQSDPHWRDLILFYEYLHGDNGADVGASHQTGWTGLVARLIGLSAGVDPKLLLNFEQKPILNEATSPHAGAATAG